MPTPRWRIAATTMAAAGAVAATVLAAPPASATPLPTSDCHLFAETPVLSTGYVYGVGGRAGCVSTYRTVTVRIRKDIAFWPDKTLAEVTEPNVLNIRLAAIWDCYTGESATVFTETLNNTGGKVQSSRTWIYCWG